MNHAHSTERLRPTPTELKTYCLTADGQRTFRGNYVLAPLCGRGAVDGALGEAPEFLSVHEDQYSRSNPMAAADAAAKQAAGGIAAHSKHTARQVHPTA